MLRPNLCPIYQTISVGYRNKLAQNVSDVKFFRNDVIPSWYVWRVTQRVNQGAGRLYFSHYTKFDSASIRKVSFRDS